jgi:hypothetical protein
VTRTYRVTAKRWERGWELYVKGVGVTQCRVLNDAERRVRGLVDTMSDETVGEYAVDVRIDLGGLEDEARSARDLAARAAEVRSEAAAATRAVTAKLRSAGLSLADVGTILGVSRSRAAQLAE